MRKGSCAVSQAYELRFMSAQAVTTRLSFKHESNYSVAKQHPAFRHNLCANLFSVILIFGWQLNFLNRRHFDK